MYLMCYFGMLLIVGWIDLLICVWNYNVFDVDMYFCDNCLILMFDWEIVYNFILSNVIYWLKSKWLFCNFEEYVYDIDSGFIDWLSNFGIVYD